MITNDCKKCPYSKLEPGFKEFYMASVPGTPWFQICDKKQGNPDFDNIYCFTSGIELKNLRPILKAYEDFKRTVK
jgi:hypothetical protein